jgi:uncharacterized protein YciI
MKRATASPARLAAALPARLIAPHLLLLALLLPVAGAVAPIAGAAEPLATPAAATTARAAEPPAAPPPAATARATEPPAAPAATAVQPSTPHQDDVPPNMATYYVALLRRGPSWTSTMTPEVQKALDGHMANIRRLAAAGKLLVAGPFLEQSGPGTLAGLFVLQAGSVAEAQQLVASDPAVQAGRFVAEVLPWLGPKSLQNLNAAPPHR